MTDISRRLAIARIAAGYPSQAAAARAMGVKRQLINQWERGRPPTTASLFRAAQCYEVSADWLLGLPQRPEVPYPMPAAPPTVEMPVNPGVEVNVSGWFE